MDNSNSVTDKNLNLSLNSKSEYLQSQQALKLALQTMKERCQKLQKRLTHLEDENLQLRIERHTVPVPERKETKTEFFPLHKQIEELAQQKSLLGHHVYMVAMENKELWGRLSSFSGYIENKSTEESLNNNLMKPEKSLNILDSFLKDGRTDSMEEIPLKLNDGKPANISLKNFDFALDMDIAEENGVNEGLMVEIKKILEKMRNEKIVLKQQKEGLKSVFETIAKFIKEKQTCKNCMILQEELNKEKNSKKEVELTNAVHQEESFDPSLRREPNFNISKTKENNFEDRICPLCTKFYPKSTPFDEFNEHVLSHFVEEPDQDSLMSNYEILA